MKDSRYTLDELIGEGGFGQVWRGTLTGEMGFSKTVAIKVLLPGMSIDQGRTDSLLHEALLGARLKHRNIVEVHEFTRDEDRLLMVMDFVDGQTLSSLIAAHPHGLDPSRVREILHQIVQGLAYAHELSDSEGKSLGLIHRDLKPSNIMIAQDGTVKICDFGIALSSLAERNTATGMVRGTPNYMSPEQIRGLPITSAIDIWALGAIAFEMLTGRRLVEGADPRSVVLQIPAVVGAAAAAEVEARAVDLSHLIEACLRQAADIRPGAADIAAAFDTGDLEVRTLDVLPRSGSAEQTMHFATDTRTLDVDGPPDVTRSDAGLGTVDKTGLSRAEFWTMSGMFVVLFVVMCTVVVLSVVVERFEEGANGTEQQMAGSEAGPTPAAVVPEKYGGTLRFGVPGRLNRTDDIFSGIDSWNRFLRGSILETLSTIKDGEPRLQLLADRSVSADGTVITLTLREDIRFHSHPCLSESTSTQATADDLAYSIQIAHNRRAVHLPLADDAPITVTGDRTVEVRLAHPTAYCDKAIMDVPLLPAAIDGCDPPESMAQPVSTGAFRLHSITPTGKGILERFDDYWRRDADGNALPYLDRLEYVPYTSLAGALTDVRSGALDMVIASRDSLTPYVVDTSSPRPTLKPEYTDGRIHIGVPRSGSFRASIAIFPVIARDGPMRKPAFRRAVGFAVDRASVSELLPTGHRPQGRILTNDMIGYDPSLTGFQLDLDRVKAELVEAGYPGGRGLAPVILGTVEAYEKPAQRVKASLQAAGIPARIEMLDLASIHLAWEGGKVDAIIGGAGHDTYAGEMYGLTRSLGLVMSEEGRELGRQITETLNRDERAQLFGELERLILQDASPVIPLVKVPADYPTLLLVFGPAVQNAFDPVTGRKIVDSFTDIYREPTDGS